MKFRDLLHETIQEGLRDGVDDIQINGAIQTQQGWMHIHGGLFLCIEATHGIFTMRQRNYRQS